MLVIDEQRAQLECLYEGIAKHCDLDLRHLSSKEQKKLSKYFKNNVEIEKYDRIIFFIRFKWTLRQAAFLRTIPNLVILEHDACQNYCTDSKYQHKFSRYFKALPWARILVSGQTLAEKFQHEGCDAIFVPKGYDQNMLYNMQQKRTTELGFIGTISHSAYEKRRTLLGKAKDSFGLIITKTDSGEDYLKALNEIKLFLSADIGFDENMIKNFEAMACGCALIAYNQGNTENLALGFEDMKNVVLYDSIGMLEEKLLILRNDTHLAERIAKEGQALAERNFRFNDIGRKIIDAITPALRDKNKASIMDHGRYFFRR